MLQQQQQLNRLPHVWGPEIIILKINKNVGDEALHWNLKGQPHVLLEFNNKNIYFIDTKI